MKDRSRFEGTALFLGALVLLMVSISFISILGWLAYTRTVEGSAEFLQAIGVVITAIQAILSTVIAFTALRAVAATNESIRMAKNERYEDSQRRRQDAVSRLIGATHEVVAFAAPLTEVQELGLRHLRIGSRSEETIRIATWLRLIEAIAATSRAFTELKFAAPDLIEPAGQLFDLVLEFESSASEGRLDELGTQAARMHELGTQLSDHLITTQHV
jgi:hypothetical protein